MRVKDLIKALERMPPDAWVFHIWDGEPRTEIVHVWLSRGGDVMTADANQVVYSEKSRPPHAPTERESSYWDSPDAPAGTLKPSQL